MSYIFNGNIENIEDTKIPLEVPVYTHDMNNPKRIWVGMTKLLQNNKDIEFWYEITDDNKEHVKGIKDLIPQLGQTMQGEKVIYEMTVKFKDDE